MSSSAIKRLNWLVTRQRCGAVMAVSNCFYINTQGELGDECSSTIKTPRETDEIGNKYKSDDGET